MNELDNKDIKKMSETMTTKEIAEALNVNYTKVYNYMIRKGIRACHYRYEVKINDILEDASYMTVTDLSKKYQISRNTISNILMRNNIEPFNKTKTPKPEKMKWDIEQLKKDAEIMTIYNIAEKYDSSYDAVEAVLRINKIKAKRKSKYDYEFCQRLAEDAKNLDVPALAEKYQIQQGRLVTLLNNKNIPHKRRHIWNIDDVREKGKTMKASELAKHYGTTYDKMIHFLRWHKISYVKVKK